MPRSAACSSLVHPRGAILADPAERARIAHDLACSLARGAARFRSIRDDAVREALATGAAPEDLARFLGVSYRDVVSWSEDTTDIPAQRSRA